MPVDARAEAFAKQFLALVDAAAPDLVEAFWITGSAVLDDWRPGASDLDFVAVFAHPPSQAEREALKSAHALFAKAPRAPKPDGPWLSKGDLARAAADAPAGYASRDGLVAGSNAHRDPITWRILARHGVAVRGETPPQVCDDDAAVIAWLRSNLRDYWGGWARRGRRLVSIAGLALLLPWGVVWTTLGVCRQLYTLETGDITSKSGAGRWAAKTYPQWKRVLEEAVRLRGGARSGSSYRSALARRRDVLAFLAWATSQP